jgi:hypothetical protein
MFRNYNFSDGSWDKIIRTLDEIRQLKNLNRK